MNVLIKVEMPDGFTPPKVDEVNLGDDMAMKGIKVVEVISEPYYLNYTKGETQVHEGLELHVTDNSEEPLRVTTIDKLPIREEQQGVPRETVNHPDHYNHYKVEVIEMMVRIWGAEKTADFCEVNAFKYRMRAGLKDFHGKEDLEKEKWYLDKAKELRDA